MVWCGKTVRYLQIYSPGTYLITVLDADGFDSTTNAITINNPAALAISVTVVGSTVTITANGGTGVLTYSINGVDFQLTPVFTDVPDGVYIVSVRDANECAISQQIIVAVNSLLATIEITQPISCAGAADGVLLVTANGGIPPYTYVLNGSIADANNLFTDLPAGEYVAIVTDAAGMMFALPVVTLTAPLPLEAMAATASDTLNVMTTGGTLPYLYSLDAQVFQTDSTFTGLPNGIYTVFVQDANGCEATTQAEIFTATDDVRVPDGALKVYPNPNDGRFRVQWEAVHFNAPVYCRIYNMAGQVVYQLAASHTNNHRIDIDLSDLPAGAYQLFITDRKQWGSARVVIGQ
ncbi:MAG: T9SS type A sorting domain-containing protein [Saprospiraceae bacterium]